MLKYQFSFFSYFVHSMILIGEKLAFQKKNDLTKVPRLYFYY